MVRWPGRIKPGARIDAHTTNLDWFPTILAMAGVDQPKAIVVRGENLVPLLTGETHDTERDGVFSFLSFYLYKRKRTVGLTGKYTFLAK